jgi:hypothetical protein
VLVSRTVAQKIYYLLIYIGIYLITVREINSSSRKLAHKGRTSVPFSVLLTVLKGSGMGKIRACIDLTGISVGH